MKIKHIFYVFVLLTIYSASSQELQFQRELDTIPFYFNDIPVAAPFAGGSIYSHPAIADIDHDGDFDICVGDEDGWVRFYRNVGSKTTPSFVMDTSIDTIQVGSQSHPCLIDIDGDSDVDLLVGEADGVINLYENVGSGTTPNFSLVSEFFGNIGSEEEIVPTFVDIDHDADPDLFDGKSFYRNVGSATAPIFSRDTSCDLTGIQGDDPAFFDIDNDHDYDLFMGGRDGMILFYRNVGTPELPSFVFEPLLSIDIGFNSAPAVADIDADNDADLIVGEMDGNINLFKNLGLGSNSKFIREETTIDSVCYGSSGVPTMADIDADQDLDLFIGRGDGSISYFENIGSKYNPFFSNEVQNYADINVGSSCAPVFVDIDADNDLDLFAGKSYGALSFYRNIGNSQIPTFELNETTLDSFVFSYLSTPAFSDIDNDGDYDLFVGELDGNINFLRNNGNPREFEFSFETDIFENIKVGFYSGCSAPFLTDFDNDSDMDLFIGSNYGRIHYYENVGSPQNPDFILANDIFGDIDYGYGNKLRPVLQDYDGDSDMDLIIGVDNGLIHFYENNGKTSQLDLQLATSNLLSLNFSRTSTPQFCDIDNDQDYDIFVGEYDGNLNFFRNIGTRDEPVFRFETENFVAPDRRFQSAPCFLDMDSDSDLDLFVGYKEGSVSYYQNIGNVNNPNLKLVRHGLIHVGGTELPYYRSIPSGSDIDRDGDIDLLIGHKIYIWFGKNDGSPTSPYFWRFEGSYWPGTHGSPSPTFADIDYDFCDELFIGSVNGVLSLFRYHGNPEIYAGYIFEKEILPPDDNRIYCAPTFADIDNDGDQDLLVGESQGGLHFYRNVSNKERLVNLSDNVLDFECVDIDSQKTKSFTISNIGTYPLKLVNISMDSASEFSVVTPVSFPITLATDSTQLFQVTFSPITSGEKIDTLTILCNDPFQQYVMVTLLGSCGTIVKVEQKSLSPITFKLDSNYPNPFNSNTTIDFQVAKKKQISLDIFDILGKHVITLVNAIREPGYYSISWDGKDAQQIPVSSGIYLVRYRAGNFVDSKSILLLR